MSRDPLAFRNPTIVVAVLGYVYDADGPVPWEELVDAFASADHQWKTVENVLYELVAFGALHRTGAPARKTLPDTRALRPTPLGRAWLDRELLDLPGQLAALGEADEIARRYAEDLDLPVHTLEPGSEG